MILKHMLSVPIFRVPLRDSAEKISARSKKSVNRKRNCRLSTCRSFFNGQKRGERRGEADFHWVQANDAENHAGIAEARHFRRAAEEPRRPVCLRRGDAPSRSDKLDGRRQARRAEHGEKNHQLLMNAWLFVLFRT